MICESRSQHIAYTVKFTRFAYMITLKRSFIDQSQKLVTAYTKPQVRIVSSYFTCNYNIKQNITMNINKSQKHGPLLHLISLKRNQGPHKNCNASYCLTKISIPGKRSIFRVFSLFIVPSPFFVHCPYKGRINRAESVLTGLKPY